MNDPAAPDNLRAYPILYVDDEEPNRLVFEAAFCDEFTVVCAASADAALEALAERPFAVLLADQRMPGMTGIELCERVRERHPTLLRLLVTAHSDQTTAIEAINRGGVARYLTKPWTHDEVRLVLREAIERVRLETTVASLRNAILDRERAGMLSAMRARVLHDLANLDMVVADACASLTQLLDPLRGVLDAALYEQVDAAVSKLGIAVDHITDLHRQRTRTSQLVPGTREFHRVRDILDTVRELVRVELAGRARLAVACPDDAVVYADRTDVARILMNLVTNALQAIDEGGDGRGEIAIEVSRDDGTILIDVLDSGPGIPIAEAERLFEPAFTTRQERGGSGLGLAICRELAQANEGAVALCDRPEGERTLGGACFRVTLPALP